MIDEVFAECELEPFDAILAEDYSLYCHEKFGDECPHNIGIKLAQMAWKWREEVE